MPRRDLPPILLSEVREAGLALNISCGHPDCHHRVEISPDSLPLPGHLTMNDVGHRLRCTVCGRRRGNNAYPHMKGWVRHLRATGQTHRLPFWAPMVRDTDDEA